MIRFPSKVLVSHCQKLSSATLGKFVPYHLELRHASQPAVPISQRSENIYGVVQSDVSVSRRGSDLDGRKPLRHEVLENDHEAIHEVIWK